MTSYQSIVSKFETSSNENVYYNDFVHGGIDAFYQEADWQYPLLYLRPLASPGITTAKERILAFELYSLDLPSLGNQDPIQVMSNTEQGLYNTISWFNRGQYQQEIGVTLNGITPTFEAFQDRVYGWVGSISVIESGVWDYCVFPTN